MSAPAISRHLSILELNGLVSSWMLQQLPTALCVSLAARGGWQAWTAAALLPLAAAWESTRSASSTA